MPQVINILCDEPVIMNANMPIGGRPDLVQDLVDSVIRGRFAGERDLQGVQ
jgi:hypothetical protein